MIVILGVLLVLPVLLLLVFRAWYKWQMGQCSPHYSAAGKVALITGGTAGIGRHTALELAKRQAEAVIITGRDIEKGKRVCDELRQLTGNSNIHFYQLDLSSMANVRTFAQKIRKDYPRIDMLINNAGMSVSTRQLTEEGTMEMTMAGNYYGPFLLTNLLLPNLEKSEQGRIVNLSSMVYKQATLSIDDLTMEKKYDGFTGYKNSKLANLLFTRRLARNLSTAKSRITCNAVHPGIVATELFRTVPSAALRAIIGYSMTFIFKTPADGAQTSLFCALHPDLSLVSGIYFEDCRANFALLPTGTNDKLGDQLWDHSIKLLGLDTKNE